MLIRFLLILTVCLWGWSFVATKICLEFLTPLQVIAMRYVIGLPVMFAVITFKRRPLKIERGDRWMLLAATAVITLHFLIQVAGMQWTSATNTGWLISVTPLVMVVLSFFFLGERLTLRAVVGVIVATVGVLLLISRGAIGNLDWLKSVGDWLVFASAHTWAIFTIMTRDLSRKYPPLSITFLMLVISALVIVPLALITTDMAALGGLSSEAIVALLFLGVPVQGLAFWFWQEGVAKLGASRAGIFLYLEPLATTGLAVPYLGESFGLFAAFGGALVLVGVYLAARRRRAIRQAPTKQ